MQCKISDSQISSPKSVTITVAQINDHQSEIKVDLTNLNTEIKLNAPGTQYAAFKLDGAKCTDPKPAEGGKITTWILNKVDETAILTWTEYGGYLCKGEALKF
jgi:hypothetical protein